MKNQKGSVNVIPLFLVIAVVGVISYLLVSSTAPLGGIGGEINPKPVSKAASSALPNISGCQIFPSDNIWNTPIDSMPVSANSSDYVATIGPTSPLHPDFGTGTNGIPIISVPGIQPKVPVSFTYTDESDPGPYPIPTNAPIEGGSGSTGDRHVLVLDQDNCVLYELFSSFPQSNGTWNAGSGAVYQLNSDVLRPSGWTSADAAGLPILPGLVRYDEVLSGSINHAIRFTAPLTQKAFIWPARHFASSSSNNSLAPMGVRFRLKANFDISTYSTTNQIILKALKKYGMILADNGSAWFITGVPDNRWDDSDLHNLTKIAGNNFEAIDESSLMISANSGQAKAAAATPTPSPSKTPSPTPVPTTVPSATPIPTTAPTCTQAPACLFQSPPCVPVVPSGGWCPLKGDIDGNNRVDIFDYNTLLTNFGKTGTGIVGDIDGNGVVDIFDYNALVNDFGKHF